MQQSGHTLIRGHIGEVLNSKPYDVVHYHNISLLGPTS